MNTERKQRESRLRQILGGKKLSFNCRKELLSSRWASEIYDIYKQLGGILDDFPSRIGQWDVSLSQSVAVDNFGSGRDVLIELDEEQHLNRYRCKTLKAAFYGELASFPREEYIQYCKSHEDAALRKAAHGGFWTNKSSEKQFGPAGVNGILDGNGSPRWKQRAFYDMLKDLTPLLVDISVARISVWDRIFMEKNTWETVDDILKRDPGKISVKQVEALKILISSRFSRNKNCNSEHEVERNS